MLQTFYKKTAQMARKDMNIYSREMQIKAVARYNFMPTMWEKTELWQSLLGRVEINRKIHLLTAGVWFGKINLKTGIMS